MAIKMEQHSGKNDRVALFASFADQFYCLDFIHYCFVAHEEPFVRLERVFTKVSDRLKLYKTVSSQFSILVHHYHMGPLRNYLLVFDAYLVYVGFRLFLSLETRTSGCSYTRSRTPVLSIEAGTRSTSLKLLNETNENTEEMMLLRIEFKSSLWKLLNK
jgi:hypothetical protein